MDMQEMTVVGVVGITVRAPARILTGGFKMFKAVDEFLYIILSALFALGIYQLGYKMIDYRCELFVCEM